MKYKNDTYRRKNGIQFQSVWDGYIDAPLWQWLIVVAALASVTAWFLIKAIWG